YSAVVVEPTSVRVDVVVDRAEIPTRQTFPDLDGVSGELPGGSEAAAAQQCTGTARGARLQVDGEPVPLTVTAESLDFPPGAAGLRTARLVCRLTSGDVGRLVGARVDFSLIPPPGPSGWHETTAAGDGTRLAGSDVPVSSISDALRQYPDDLLTSPLDVRSASFVVRSGSGVVDGIGALLASGPLDVAPGTTDRVTDAFTDLVARDRLDAGFVLLALLVATALGGAHAFAPGHGKTLMAAYLLGRGGSVRDAAVIGASVTATHTLGVLSLGIGLTALGLAAPERLYPWLTLTSGLLLAGIGVALLRSATRRRRSASVPDRTAPALLPASAPPGPHDRHHAYGHREHDHGHAHEHAQGHDHGGRAVAVQEHPRPVPSAQPHSHGLLTHTHEVPPPGRGARELLAVGFAGGLVPSPSALVVLVGGIALGRAWFGVVLVVFFGVGMALALTLTGLLLARGRDRVARALSTAGHRRPAAAALRIAALLPAVTAAVVLLVGTGVMAGAALQLTRL
ncbi:MAG TPA: hypothetical protein VNU26_10360, partial [Mycobacteriales bacterium]|nr:hypothetical protein [Mycobacteriales bacterium]